MQENQYVHGAGGDVDIFGVAVDAGQACVQGLFVRDGRLLGNRTWFPKNELAVADGGTAVRLRLPVLPGRARAGDAEDRGRRGRRTAMRTSWPTALTDRAGRRVEVASQVRGQRARWADMATENARMSLAAYAADRQNVLGRFVALQAALGWEDIPERLECFDISHSAGEATVASCVVFDTEGPLKSDYRRYNIEGVPRGDDYGAIEQVMRRRYTRLVEGEGALPDAIIIDGGAGQVGRAAEVLDQLQVKDIALLGIAKGPTRKAGLRDDPSGGPRRTGPARRTAAPCICCSISATRRIGSRSPDTVAGGRRSAAARCSTTSPASDRAASASCSRTSARSRRSKGRASRKSPKFPA